MMPNEFFSANCFFHIDYLENSYFLEKNAIIYPTFLFIYCFKMNIDLMKYVELSKYDILSYEFAEYLDDNDILNNIKDEFIFPLINNKKSIYLIFLFDS